MDSTEHEIEEQTYTVRTYWIVYKEIEVTAENSKKAFMKARKEQEKFFRENEYNLMDGTGWVESDDEEEEQESNLDEEVKALTDWLNSRPKEE